MYGLSKNIGKKLYNLRKKNLWSQEQTAEYLKVSRSVYQRIENGEGNSWAGYLDRICEVFQLTAEELVSESPIVFNQNQQGGNSSNSIIANYSNEKIIEHLESIIKEKQVIIEQQNILITTLTSSKK